jgi:hypothetical protein
VTARARMWAAAPWGVAAIVGALIARFAVRVHSLQPDEKIAVAASRHVLDHPLSALDPSVNLSGRGLERGVAVLFAAVQAISGDTARAYWVQHALGAFIFATVVAVVAGFARDLGLERLQALIAGVVAGCVPWMVLGTSLLNSNPAYPLTVLALWAMWRAIVAPGPARELVALAALALLAVTRIGNVVLAAAWPLGIAAFALHDRAPGVGLLAATRALPRRVWREHPLVVALGVAGVLVLVVGGTHWLVGGYPVHAPLGRAFRALLRLQLSYLAMGTAVVPAALALAWCARSLVRPADPGAAAFAALGAGAYVAFAYVAATQGAEERYMAPLAPVLLLMAMVALSRRAVGPLLVLAAGFVVARAITVTGTGADIGPYGFFAQPAQSFFRRIVIGKASLFGPVPDTHVLMTVLVAAVAAAVIAVLLARHRPRLVYVIAAVGIGGYGLVAGVYSMRQFVTQAGYETLTFDQQSWIDGAVGAGADVALAPQGLEYVMGELSAFNRSLGSPYAPRRANLVVDRETGALSGAPRYLVVQDGLMNTIGVTGKLLAQTTYLPTNADLIRLAPRAQWLLTSPRSVRVFAAGENDCLTVTLAQPAGATARERFRIDGVVGTLEGSVPQPLAIRLPAGQRATDLRLRGGGAATFLALSRGPCG